VRELQNIIGKTLLAARGYAIALADLKEAIGETKRGSGVTHQTLSEYAAQLLAAAQRYGTGVPLAPRTAPNI
jgi:transcriptional regulator of acetoin/glycerol metabolism